MSENNIEVIHKEIDLIQACIARMTQNSFLIKGWAVTLIVGSLLLKGRALEGFIAFIPLISFWILDAYFLQQERLYRKLYDWVVKNRLKTSEHLYELSTARFNGEVQSIPRTMVSITLGVFYGSIAILLAIYVGLLLKFQL